MSGRFKGSIRRELFGLFLAVLALHSLVLLAVGSRLFHRFYVNGKVSELKSAAKMIQRAYRDKPEELFEVVDRVEDRNTIVTLFSLEEDGSLTADYYTRFHDPGSRHREDASESGAGKREMPPFVQFFRELEGRPFPYLDEQELHREIGRLSGERGELLILQDEDAFGGRLRILGALEEGRYLQVDTPLDYIRSIADQAVRYTSYLSAAVLLAGALGIYLLSGRITRPIRRMQSVAGKIARLDFSERCDTRPRGELGALGESINHMASQLQANIEQLVAANAVLQSDLERQQQTDRMRRKFIADVSHDFKTPLTLIVSYAEALGEEPDARQREEFAGIIIEEGNKLSRMVGSLLRLSQLECGMQKLEASLFCISELLEGVVSAHRILAGKKGLRVETRLESSLVVEADYQKIEQAAGNLYENAVKYASEGGRILVSAQPEGESCKIVIENDGESLAEEDLPHLFESFYRADRSRRDGQSYGLGLAIVKAIVDLHGERCGCENRPGGARFWFTLRQVQMEEDL